jgi:hypothetical protein
LSLAALTGPPFERVLAVIETVALPDSKSRCCCQTSVTVSAAAAPTSKRRAAVRSISEEVLKVTRDMTTLLSNGYQRY